MVDLRSLLQYSGPTALSAHRSHCTWRPASARHRPCAHPGPCLTSSDRKPCCRCNGRRGIWGTSCEDRSLAPGGDPCTSGTVHLTGTGWGWPSCWNTEWSQCQCIWSDDLHTVIMFLYQASNVTPWTTTTTHWQTCWICPLCPWTNVGLVCSSLQISTASLLSFCIWILCANIWSSLKKKKNKKKETFLSSAKHNSHKSGSQSPTRKCSELWESLAAKRLEEAGMSLLMHVGHQTQ